MSSLGICLSVSSLGLSHAMKLQGLGDSGLANEEVPHFPSEPRRMVHGCFLPRIAPMLCCNASALARPHGNGYRVMMDLDFLVDYQA